MNVLPPCRWWLVRAAGEAGQHRVRARRARSACSGPCPPCGARVVVRWSDAFDAVRGARTARRVRARRCRSRSTVVRRLGDRERRAGRGRRVVRAAGEAGQHRVRADGARRAAQGRAGGGRARVVAQASASRPSRLRQRRADSGHRVRRGKAEPVNVPPLSVTLTVGAAWLIVNVVLAVAAGVVRAAGEAGQHRVRAGRARSAAQRRAAGDGARVVRQARRHAFDARGRRRVRQAVYVPPVSVRVIVGGACIGQGELWPRPRVPPGRRSRRSPLRPGGGVGCGGDAGLAARVGGGRIGRAERGRGPIVRAGSERDLPARIGWSNGAEPASVSVTASALGKRAAGSRGPRLLPATVASSYP